MKNKKLKDGCYFVSLGGCEEIGRNFNMYGIVKGDIEQWVLVDVGVSIERNFGISLQIPAFDFALSKIEHIVGAVFTHGHDDHIGASPFIIPKLNEALRGKRPENKKGIPIFATKFTLGLIYKKFDEYNENGNFIEIFPNKPFQVGEFEFEMLYVTHSIPEANMVKMTLKPFNYKVLHTGDWKFDPDPVIGGPTNEDYLRKLGDEGIDLLICDSTNALEENETPPEGMVRDNLKALIKKNHGRRIIVSCFASNVARIKMLYDMSKEFGRKIVLFGKSLLRIVEVAMNTGYLDTKMEVYKSVDVPDLDPNKTIIICTGSQGEKGSILYRLAYSNRSPFAMKAGDMVIFSARKIPGNEKEIIEMQSALIKHGAEIIDGRAAKVHVSGHPSKPEIKRLIELLRPKRFVPVHGQALNFAAMVKIAKECNVPQIFTPTNGGIIDLIRLEIAGEIEVGLLGIDGYQMIDMRSQVINTRKILSESGAIFISVIPGQKPVICSYGVLPDNNYKNFLNEVARITSQIMTRYKRNVNRKEIISEIISEINAYIRLTFGKNPLVSVHILSN